MKKTLAVLAISCLAMMANAAPVSCASISIGSTTTFGQLQSSGGCQDQDKQYTDWTGNLPSDTLISIQTVAGLVDTHILTIGDLDIGAWTLGYIIAIDPLAADNALRNITGVTLGFDSAGAAGNSATKTIYAGGSVLGGVLDTLFSNGSTDASVAMSEKSLLIMEAISVTNGTYTSTSNSFTQAVDAVVPEPATNALIGCGLLGLVWLRRKMKSAEA